MSSTLRCPRCKRGQLSSFHSSGVQTTFQCDDCDQLTQVEKSGNGWKVVTAGGAVVTGTLAVLNFFGIDDIHDLFT